MPPRKGKTLIGLDIDDLADQAGGVHISEEEIDAAFEFFDIVPTPLHPTKSTLCLINLGTVRQISQALIYDCSLPVPGRPDVTSKGTRLAVIWRLIALRAAGFTSSPFEAE